ncbi:MAG: LysM peptidoglycan-binding domain-containing protein [Planctomycetaceae bacterium]|nr:LysM peptidoglycan-binding domain-containing protein [Planctomycetaceae bacterium]
MKILKIAKIFVITIVVCLALFGAYKLLKPAPTINIPDEDITYLNDLGINFAEGGKASESGASPLLGNIEGILPLNSTENTQSQTPPSSLGNNPPNNNGNTPIFGIDNHNPSTTTNSNAPLFNPTTTSTSTSTTATATATALSASASTSTANNPNSAPVWDYRQETNSNPPLSNSPLSNSPTSAILSSPNPPLTANLTLQVESKSIAPSYPYGSQENAPTLNIPPAIVPTLITPTTPVVPTTLINETIPVSMSTPMPTPMPTPTSTPEPFPSLPNNNSLNQTTAFPSNITETPKSTLPNSPTPSNTIYSVLTPPPVNTLPPAGNQTLTPPTPILPISPPPSPPPTTPINAHSLNTQSQQHALQPTQNLNSTFVNTGLRGETTINSNLNSNSNTNSNTNLFHPTSTHSESITIPTNDPDYYSSAVPIPTSFPQTSTSSPKQINTSFSSSEMATLEKPSQQPDFSSDFSSNTLSPPSQNTENQHNRAGLIKPLPLVVEPIETTESVESVSSVESVKSVGQDKKYIIDSNNKFTNASNNGNQFNVTKINNAKNSTNNTMHLWDDYLNKTKQNNEAVLEPSRETAGNIAPRVTFAKEESSINNFNPNYSGNNSTDIFSANKESSAVGSYLNNSNAYHNSNTETTLTTPVIAENPLNGVIATSNPESINYTIARLDKNHEKNKDNASLIIKTNNNYSAGINSDRETRDSNENSRQNKDSEKKFDGTIINDSTELPTIPFVSPQITPHPVLITNDLTSGNVADNKSRNNLSNHLIRETVVRLVNEQLREYSTKEHSKMHLAFVQLSKFYDQRDLSDGERDYVASILDRIALELIYSSKYHVLEPVYTVKAGDTIDSVAQKFSISSALLSKINGLNRAEQLTVGGELKVVHGQFDAKVQTSRGELTLLLGGVYAGRFPVAIGRNILDIRGEFIVKNKSISRTTKNLTLNNGIMLNGLGRQITPDSLGVSQESIEELFDILTENSVIVME